MRKFKTPASVAALAIVLASMTIYADDLLDVRFGGVRTDAQLSKGWNDLAKHPNLWEGDEDVGTPVGGCSSIPSMPAMMTIDVMPIKFFAEPSMIAIYIETGVRRASFIWTKKRARIT